MSTEVARAIREVRKRRGMYSYQLAKRMGTSTSTLSRIELGQIGITDDTICAAARALNAPEILEARCSQCPVGRELRAMLEERQLKQAA